MKRVEIILRQTERNNVSELSARITIHLDTDGTGYLFVEAGRKYMISSSMTGYNPNQSDTAEESSWTEAFLIICDPMMRTTHLPLSTVKLEKLSPV